MFSPEVEQLIKEKSGDFIIPARKIAIVQDDNPLMHAFLILTKVRYSKIPVLDAESRIVGLLSLAMITDPMLTTQKIDTDVLNTMTVRDVMQTDFDTIQVTEPLEHELHLLVDNAFLPVVDANKVFQGMLTRRELIKSFNYVAHELNEHYSVTPKIATSEHNQTHPEVKNISVI